jgi:hypothetical protein
MQPLMPTIDQVKSQVEKAADPATNQSRSAPEATSGVSNTLAFGAVAAALLIWVAVYNGYPTVVPDSGNYISVGAFHIALPPYRAPGYSVFIHWSSFGRSAWFTVLAQAIIVVYVLRETYDYLLGGGRIFLNRCLLAGVGTLAVLTGLPWVVSELMPDVFSGMVFLCAFLLAFAGQLRLWQRILLASILMISIASHLSLLLVSAAFLSVLVVLRLAMRKTQGFPPAWSVAGWLLVPLLAAGLLTATLNRSMGKGFTLSPAKNSFLLARLFGDGLAADYLRENCPKRPFISCRWLSNLPRGDSEFLFLHPLIGELQGHEDEIDTLAHETIRSYPGRFLASSAKQTLIQLVTLRTGDEIRMPSAEKLNFLMIQRVFPHDLRAFSNDRQFLDIMLPLTNAISYVHVAFFWLSVALCLNFAWTGRFARMNRFLSSAFLFLFFNAAVCGALGGITNRYQCRVAWIIPFCLIAYICCLIKARKRGQTGLDSTGPELA